MQQLTSDPDKPRRSNERAYSKMMSLRLPNELAALLDHVADQEEQSRSQVVIDAVEHYLKQRASSRRVP